MSPRIDPLEAPYPEEVAGELAAMMPPGVEPLRLFRTLARNPRILRKIRASNLLDRGSLARRDRELVILRTCARCGAEYEWGVHVAFFAARVGLSEAEVAATAGAGAEAALGSARDRSLLRLVDELHDTQRISPALWRELASHWSEPQRIELIALVGFYHAVSFLVNGLELEPEEGAARFPPGPRPGAAPGAPGGRMGAHGALRR